MRERIRPTRSAAGEQATETAPERSADYDSDHALDGASDILDGDGASDILDGLAYRMLDGDALTILTGLPAASIDGLIADPPYCSGALWSSGRKAAPEVKYQQAAQRDRYATFLGEARDQRSYCRWSAWWLAEALRVCKPGAPACVFTDWRQLPVITDAFQAAGWTWRGVAVWDKTGACRPQRGRFAAQAEYIVWGSSGAMPRERDVPALPGVFTVRVDTRDKHHIAGKPIALMTELVRVVAAGGLILDPFAGSGSTGVAALRSGRRFLGVELHAPTAALARSRLAAAASATAASATADSAAPVSSASRTRRRRRPEQPCLFADIEPIAATEPHAPAQAPETPHG